MQWTGQRERIHAFKGYSGSGGVTLEQSKDISQVRRSHPYYICGEVVLGSKSHNLESLYCTVLHSTALYCTAIKYNLSWKFVSSLRIANILYKSWDTVTVMKTRTLNYSNSNDIIFYRSVFLLLLFLLLLLLLYFCSYCYCYR